MDQGVEPPSWLPDGAASSDTKGPASRDSAADDPDTAGVESQGPVSFGPVGHGPVGHDPVSDGLGIKSPAIPSSVGDPPAQDVAADDNAYTYAGETSYPNGRDTSFGQESASVSAYGQESSHTGASGGPSSYPTQFGDTPAFGETLEFRETPPAAEKTGDVGRRTTVSPTITRPKAESGSAAKTGATRGRRADLVLARLEPWSVMKFSFLVSLVAWVMLFVAVAVLYFMLSALGVFDSIQKTLESVTSSSGSPGVSLTKWFSESRILGYTMLIGAVNIVLITALSTVGAMIYNLVTHLGGGVEVTLRETD